MLRVLSQSNHFKFGYNDRWFVTRTSPEDRWSVTYGRASRPVGSWRDECVDTARSIGRHADGDIWVLFSGGIDSEVVVQSFLFAGVPFRVAITRFAHEMNRHDITYAVQFCERADLGYRMLDIDIERFFASGKATDYARETRCVQPQLLHTMWAIDQLDGYPVLGSGECLLVPHPPDDEANAPSQPLSWHLYEKERIAAWYRLLILRGRDGCAGFFQFTPENMLSFLLDPVIRQLCSGADAEIDSTDVKHQMYRQHFLLQRRPKFHGFERVLSLDAGLRPFLEREHGSWNQIVMTEYRELLDLLRGCGQDG